MYATQQHTQRSDIMEMLLQLILGLSAGAAASPPAPTPLACAAVPGGGGAGTCYVGAAIDRLPELDAAACCAACAADAEGQCAAWEIRADQDGICVLKAGPAVPRPSGGSSGNCSSSGTIGTPPPPGPAPGPPAPPPGGLAFDSMFFGGAVLQMGVETAVWGWNAPTTAITLTLDGEIVARAAPTGGSDGNHTWRAQLPPMQQGSSHRLRVDSGGQSDTVTVSFGVVILCSGQSNMVCGDSQFPHAACVMLCSSC